MEIGSPNVERVHEVLMVEAKERCLVECLKWRPVLVRFPTVTLTELTEKVELPEEMPSMRSSIWSN